MSRGIVCLIKVVQVVTDIEDIIQRYAIRLQKLYFLKGGLRRKN